MLVVYFTVPYDENDEEAVNHWMLTKSMLQLSAQITEREGVVFGIVDLEQDKKLASKLNVFEIGAIYCYHRGHVVEYDGQRSADIFHFLKLLTWIEFRLSSFLKTLIYLLNFYWSWMKTL